MKFISIEELLESMTDEQKEESDRLYKKYFGKYENSDPIYCGPEARAMAEGPEVLEEYYKEGQEYLKEVDMSEWDKYD